MFKAGLTVGLLIWCALILTTCQYVNTNEEVFEYNVTSGLPVNKDNNPLLGFGWHIAYGWNAKFFVVDSGVYSYNFTAEPNEHSPNDEALTWNTSEGVSMKTNFTISGHVTDPWMFYTHYGHADATYGSVPDIHDVRIYEALRQAGHYASIRMAELTQNQSADYIRANPGEFVAKLTKDTAAYMNNYGFNVTNFIFPAAFEFPGGNTIAEARSKLQAKNAEVQEKEQQKVMANNQKLIALKDAGIAANKIREEGKREANRLNTESDALAAQLSASIAQVGVDGALRLYMSEQLGQLVAKGVIDQAVLTGSSVFGQPFYPSKSAVPQKQ